MSIREESVNGDDSTLSTTKCPAPKLVVQFHLHDAKEEAFKGASITIEGSSPQAVNQREYESGSLENKRYNLKLETPYGTFQPESRQVKFEYLLKTPLETNETRKVIVPLERYEARLFLDAKRDGTLTSDDLEKWTWGVDGRGAIALCNNDGQPDKLDNMDESITQGENLADIAPLDVRATTTLRVEGFVLSLELTVPENYKRLRIFNGRIAGSGELIGPNKKHSCILLPEQKLLGERDERIELGMEAIVYDGFVPNLPTGPIELQLIVKDRGQVISTQQAQVRVAPWMMMHHLIPAKVVFAAASPPKNKPWDNATFRKDLREAIPQSVDFNGNLNGQGDRWAQDCMEFGVSNLPHHQLPIVLRAPRSLNPSLMRIPVESGH